MNRFILPIILLTALLGGGFIDFLIYGVCKIIWMVIYVPAYCAISVALFGFCARTQWKKHAWGIITAVLCGALLARLSMVNHHRLITYAMESSSVSPITLHSEEWPQILIVTSDKLQKDLASKTPKSNIPVLVEAITDYGCIKSFRVTSIDGVDVEQDPKASWTWKTLDANNATKGLGPGSEDQGYPWCRFTFYHNN